MNRPYYVSYSYRDGPGFAFAGTEIVSTVGLATGFAAEAGRLIELAHPCGRQITILAITPLDQAVTLEGA